MKDNSKKLAQRKKKREREAFMKAFEKSIWRGLVEKFGAIPQHMKDEVDKVVHDETVRIFGEAPNEGNQGNVST